MKKFFESQMEEVGTDSLEYTLLKQYAKTPEDVSRFCKIANRITSADRQPLMSAILYYIEDKVLDTLTTNQLDIIFSLAFESKQGLLELIRLDGINSFDTYQFVDECYTDEITKQFGQVFSGDFDLLDYELFEFFEYLNPADAC
ncbi:hypothetical protein [Paenibacillus bouchesdurhonensis]|uniref:hypothetical protein n=1 Tax=Paenibacillus bouchesdurhonensis TaxID=1870990 RepID=UPI000DA619C0|nr:hypothetical protein [Paenibacillus bouchesdurhonensis]